MLHRVLDLDQSLRRQPGLLRYSQAAVVPVQDWGPDLRMGCSFRRFRRFEHELNSILQHDLCDRPALTFYGSGDFHHVSLALIRRLTTPFNLVVVDKHPDWMRGLPFLHCGTWLHHAVRTPLVQRVFHVGGELDFDNRFRWLAPWRQLRNRKICVFPAVRQFQRWPWPHVAHEALRPNSAALTAGRLERLLQPFRADLRRWPLYISLDKDVLRAADSVVNWDSGVLRLPELTLILQAFIRAAGGRLSGMDVTGDWSPVEVHGWLRRLLHATEHPQLVVDPREAARRNERVNLAILEGIEAAYRPSVRPRRASA